MAETTNGGWTMLKYQTTLKAKTPQTNHWPTGGSSLSCLSPPFILCCDLDRVGTTTEVGLEIRIIGTGWFWYNHRCIPKWPKTLSRRKYYGPPQISESRRGSTSHWVYLVSNRTATNNRFDKVRKKQGNTLVRPWHKLCCMSRPGTATPVSAALSCVNAHSCSGLLTATQTPTHP